MIQARTALAGGFVLLSVAASITLAMAPGPERVTGSLAEALSSQAAPAISASASPATAQSGFLGVILARASVDLAPRFEGRVRAVNVRLGDVVSAGSIVASLEIPTLRFDLSMAEASARAAEVDAQRASVELAQAEERHARRKALSASALASGEDLASANYQQQLAGAQVEAARAVLAEKRARVGQLRRNTDDTEMRSPFDGIVAARYVDPGANVTPSTPIVRVISAHDLFVRFAAPEQSASLLAVGVPVAVSAAAVTLRGAIDKVAPEIDAASRMIIVEARVDAAGAESRVRSGEMVRVSIEEKR